MVCFGILFKQFFKFVVIRIFFRIFFGVAFFGISLFFLCFSAIGGIFFVFLIEFLKILPERFDIHIGEFAIQDRLHFVVREVLQKIHHEIGVFVLVFFRFCFFCLDLLNDGLELFPI